MRPVRNADDSLIQFRKMCNNYEQLYGPRVAELRSQYTGSLRGEPPPSLEECLEIHVKTYIVNALLTPLNWQLDKSPEDDLPNPIPGASIRSEERETILFLESGEEGQAFCEIWCFEQHLCCRTCVFEEVCAKSEVFRLPCIPPKPPAVRTITTH